MPDRETNVRAAVTAALLLAIGATALSVIAAARNTFTDHRLAPLFLLGAPDLLYPPSPIEGSMLSTIYPPLSVLLYAPALLGGNVWSTFLLAGLMAEIALLAPTLMLLRSVSSGPWILGFGASIFVLLSNFNPVLATAHLVHADAPALLCSALTVYFFARYLNSGRHTPFLVLAAVAASLAPWAKQTAVLVAAVPFLVLLAVRGWRPLLIYSGSVAILQALLTTVFVSLYGFSRLKFWIFDLPSRHPWKGTWSSVLPSANFALLETNAWCLVLVASVLVYRRPAWSIVKEPWVLCFVTGLMLWPTSVLGFVKVGGAANTLVYSTYFLHLATVLLVVSELSMSGWRPLVQVPSFIALLLLSVPTATNLGKVVLAPRTTFVSTNASAYEYSKRHPGVIYFPWHPLSVYLAERKLYAFELGVADRQAAGVALTRDDLRRHLPAAMRFVAYTGTVPESALSLLPECATRLEYTELPGWTVLGCGPRVELLEGMRPAK
ncbi:MAG: hypothetical protein SFV54_01225 [Bryobacteraceae bacterium]|nr:hypothetical protein [Bryobacteraceae bacterium]